MAQRLKHLLAMQTWVRSLGGEDPLEKEMATHYRILAWRITTEPLHLQMSLTFQGREGPLRTFSFFLITSSHGVLPPSREKLVP